MLDVATGSGDLPIRLARLLETPGCSLDLHACDISETALETTRERSERAGVPVTTHATDILADPLPEADVVTCALFMHHLTEDQAVRALVAMSRAARRLLVISDLRRPWPGLVMAAVATRLHGPGSCTSTRFVPCRVRSRFPSCRTSPTRPDSSPHRSDRSAPPACSSAGSPIMIEETLPPPTSTLEPHDVERVDWDAVVIGAGLSGSIAARGLARHGHRVLLVERTAFPRPKVCGCLGRLGRATRLDRPARRPVGGARPLEEVRLHAGGRPARVPLRDVVGVSREALINDSHARRSPPAPIFSETMADPAQDGTVRTGSMASAA